MVSTLRQTVFIIGLYFNWTITPVPPKTKGDEYVILTEELEAELKSEAPLANRLKVIKELTESCKTRKAELVSIKKIYPYPLDGSKMNFNCST